MSDGLGRRPDQGQRIGIYGAGGFALQILDMVEAAAADGAEIAFIDEQRTGKFFGFPVLSPRNIAADIKLVIALADPARRAEIAPNFSDFTSLVSERAAISRHARIGEGAILCHNTIVEAGAEIGRHFHGNIYSYVAHESIIGDFVTFAPRVNCNGRVVIGDGAYIGTGAFLKQGIRIGAGAIIGMGSVVIRDVGAGEVVAGNPARAIGSGVGHIGGMR